MGNVPIFGLLDYSCREKLPVTLGVLAAYSLFADEKISRADIYYWRFLDFF